MTVHLKVKNQPTIHTLDMHNVPCVGERIRILPTSTTPTYYYEVLKVTHWVAPSADAVIQHEISLNVQPVNP
jgi:hypothetical protein